MDNSPLMTDSKSLSQHAYHDYSQTYQTSKSYRFAADIIVALALLAVSIKVFHKDCYWKAFFNTVSAVAICTVILGISEIFLRGYRLVVELSHIKSKYDGQVVKVFEALNLSTFSWLFIAFGISTFLVLHISVGNTVQHVWSLGPVALIPAFICSVIVCKIVGFSDSKLNTSELISSMGGVDYGTGMAYNYFYGYLKIVLPADGSNKGLRFKMEEYEAIEKVTIPVKKLFILIPQSAHIPADLKEASDNWLEATKHLDSEVRDRAGVKERKYKNTVYKIHPGGEGTQHRPVYVTTEGATPLLTLWEILQHAHPQTATYREHRNQIVEAFSQTLQTLLNNDPQCTNVCELVFYNDYDDKGKLRNVGEILLKRIRGQAGYAV